MTQEIKDKLEHAAKAEIDNSVWSNHDDSMPLNVAKNALVRFAQTILDNPKEWGLMPILESMQHIEDSDSDWKDALSDLQAQNERYREALEKISNMGKGFGKVSSIIAKEALKQEEQ